MLFHQRGTTSRHYRGHAIEKSLVDDVDLGEVGDLGRPADIAQCRQQKILPHGAQKRVRRDLLGVRGKVRILGILAAQSGALALIEQEEQ